MLRCTSDSFRSMGFKVFVGAHYTFSLQSRANQSMRLFPCTSCQLVFSVLPFLQSSSIRSFISDQNLKTRMLFGKLGRAITATMGGVVAVTRMPLNTRKRGN